MEVSTDGGTTWSPATSATIAAGTTSVLVKVPTVEDTIDEFDEQFTLTASVTSGTTVNATATGTATIIDNDDSPVGVDDSVSATEGTPSNFISVLGNDSDGDNDSLSVGVVKDGSGTEQPVSGPVTFTTVLGGSVTLQTDGTYSYTAPVRNHDDAVPDVDSFEYKASDGTNLSEWTTVTINVTDTEPTALADSQTLTEDAVSLSGNVVTGINATADTLGADAATVTGVQALDAGTAEITTGLNTGIAGTYGTLTIDANGVYTYVLNAAAQGLNDGDAPTDTFSYTLKDSDGDYSTTTVTFTVNGDNDVVVFANTVSDDDDVNENTNTITTDDIVYTGTASVSSNLTLSLDGDTTLTSEGQIISYVWDGVSSTLVGVRADGENVLTIDVNDTQTGYEFKQLNAIDHALDGNTESDRIGTFTANLVTASGTVINSDTFTVTINDDVPEVTGNLTIITDNDGSHSETGFLTVASVSNDITSVTWDTSNIGAIVTDPDTGVTSVLPLTYEGSDISFVDNGDGTLTGVAADGTEVLKVTIDTSTTNDLMNPEYTFELLATAGRLGYVDYNDNEVVISGGNTGNLVLGFGDFLVDSMTAYSTANPTDATVNTNQGWVGIDGNWFNDNDNLYMDFKDSSGQDGQVRGLNLTVEGSGNSATDVYAVHWKVTAGYDDSDQLVTYSGVFYGNGTDDGVSPQTDFDFDIPLLDGAVYFTDIQVSSPEITTYPVDGSGEFIQGSYYFDSNGNHVDQSTGNVVTFADENTLPDNHDNQYRISFSGVSANNYANDIDLSLPYTLTDIDGDSASGAIDIHLDTVTPIIGYADEGIVYESGLLNGTEEGVSAIVAAGNLLINDTGLTTNTVISAVEGITSVSGVITVNTNEGVLTVYTDDNTPGKIAGDYEFTLTTATATATATADTNTSADDPINNVDVNDIESFVYTLTDEGGRSVNSALNITIMDDQPAANDITQAVEIPAQNTNLMIVLDVSGSMSDSSGIDGLNRLEAAKDAIQELIRSYDNQGDVAVQIVTFSSSANAVNTTWVNASEGIQDIESITNPSGWTNYDGALADAMVAFDSDGKIVDAQNVSYFLTDGEPTYSNDDVNTLTDTNGTTGNNSDEGIQSSEEAIWTNFLTTNNVQSFAFGVGTGLNVDPTTGTILSIDPIAYDGKNGIDTGSIAVTDFNDLTDVLNSTLPPALSGDLLTGNILDSGFGVGADGGYVSQIIVNGNTYTFDGSALTVTGSGTSTYTFDSNTNLVTIKTADQSELVVDLDDGDYSFKGNPNMTNPYSESVSFELSDTDGDKASGLVTFNVTQSLELKLNQHKVADWEFEANASNIVFDTAGTVADDGTLVGSATLTNGTLSLDGSGSVDVADSQDINLGDHNERTIVFTFKADSLGPDAYQVLYEEGGSTRGLNIFLTPDGEIGVGGWNIDASQSDWDGNWIVDNGTDLRDGSWHQVTLVLDGGTDPLAPNGSMTGYIDGVEFGSSEAGMLYAHSDDIQIGDVDGSTLIDTQAGPAGETVTSAPYSGEIAQGEIYDIALSTTEVQGLYDLNFQSGTFVDGIVIGVEYVTSSGLSGKTDSEGNFDYMPGDTVTFSIGNVVIGQLDTENMTDDIAFLQDVAGIGLHDLNDEYVENMAVFLQSLDANSDAYDGIVITQAMHDLFSDDSFDLSLMSEAELIQVLADNGITAVTEADAMQHVKDMIIENSAMTEAEMDVINTDVSLPAISNVEMTVDSINKLGNSKNAESSIKSFDFGSEYAGQAVTLSFDASQKGSQKFESNDKFEVNANGGQLVSTMPGVNDSHEYQVSLDKNGRVELEFVVDSNNSSEFLNITNIKVVFDESQSIDPIDDFMLATDDADIFEITGQDDGVQINDFDITEDTLDLSEVITDNDQQV
ncbi:MAG: Ig-like domain-containing protein, partial [Pseudomonadota bacterium]|nr:Ig-like domain-containing protein [Pseudomonadota bacterium]